MKFFQNRIVNVYPIIIFNWVFSSGYLPDFCVKFHTIPGPGDHMGIWGSPPFFDRLVHLFLMGGAAYYAHLLRLVPTDIFAIPALLF